MMDGLTLRPDQLGHRVEDVRTEGETVVVASFTDGEKRLWDLAEEREPLGVFGALLVNADLFRQVKMTRHGRAIEWPNGADADADWLYHAGRAIRVVSMTYNRTDDSLSASFRPDYSGQIEADPVAEDLAYMYDHVLKEWVGFHCEAFSRHVGDDAWLDSLPASADFFALAEPRRNKSLREVLTDARDTFLGAGTRAEKDEANAVLIAR